MPPKPSWWQFFQETNQSKVHKLAVFVHIVKAWTDFGVLST